MRFASLIVLALVLVDASLVFACCQKQTRNRIKDPIMDDPINPGGDSGNPGNPGNPGDPDGADEVQKWPRCGQEFCRRGQRCQRYGNHMHCANASKSCASICRPPRNPDWICGSDSKTYRSWCHLQIKNCQTGRDVTEEYDHPCH